MARPERILVAMSGGVDSSVAAALLKERGYELVGVTMHLWDATKQQKVGRCCAPEDRDDARRVCEQLGIPHYVLDERAAFRSEVVEPFIESYLRGETPSPCTHCNRSVKLEQLVELAAQFGAARVATGHYARVESSANGFGLLRGQDRTKDQSYFLFGIRDQVLAKMMFPLGRLTKPEVRKEAHRFGLVNANKGESQELCFVPDGNIAAFLEQERPDVPRSGRISDETGAALGEHESVFSLTVGQRRGLGIEDVKRPTQPRYVLKILPEERRVVVGAAESLYRQKLSARNAQWLSSRSDPFKAQVRIRYRHEPAPALVYPRKHGFDVHFDEPQRAITPGQAAVIYDEDRVIGGGYIEG